MVLLPWRAEVLCECADGAIQIVDRAVQDCGGFGSDFAFLDALSRQAAGCAGLPDGGTKELALRGVYESVLLERGRKLRQRAAR